MTLLLDFFFIVGMLLSAIYIYILNKANPKALSHRTLALVFMILTLVIVNSYSILHEIRILSILTFIPTSCAKFLLGPLLYIYLQSLFYDDKIIVSKYWKAFTPFFFFLVFYTIPTTLALTSSRLFPKYLTLYSEHNHLIRIISDLVFLSYLVSCYNSFLKFKKVVKSAFSSTSHNMFFWIRYMLIAAMVIISFDLLLALPQLLFNLKVGRTQNFIIILTIVFLIYTAYFGLNQSKVLIPPFLLENENFSKSKTEYVKNTSTEKAFQSMEQKLKSIILEERPYLNTDLTLGKLAELAQISDKKLSRLLNQHMNISFYDFVNNYRVEAFKEAIKKDSFPNYTVEAIAFECGFKSKASFYRIFKNKTNFSPTEFKKIG